ncbi:hypothetical protein PYCCODRAFT_1504306 [Trametes coccinea BRFM310]|uniref:Uncharacterized protein n=1 Tax=Trametes coccinea (strain BRFM310) TaxID=1353009 RepID=A0A1Y2IKC7_TRAC3|nr:hypothetical protein PYCCODRAFT_1504306 [Trametes coccinea BRFM310]
MHAKSMTPSCSTRGAVVNQLGSIFNLQWDLCKDIGGVGEKKTARADAIARVELDSGVYQQRPIAACLELKNELGVNGICEIQVAARHEKAVVQQEVSIYYAKIREASCCPSILISMAGPHIRFYGAVLADVFIVQPFTDYIFLGGDPDTESRTERVAKIFMEVRRAWDELKIWYRALSSDGGEGLTAPHHILPRPSCYARASDHALLSTLQFLDRFEYAGCRRKRPGKPSIYDFQRSLFRARLNGIEVLVKFCFRYGARVHRVSSPSMTRRSPPSYTPVLHLWAARSWSLWTSCPGAGQLGRSAVGNLSQSR